MKRVRAYGRLILFVLTISFFIGLAIISSIFGGNRVRRNMSIRRWWIMVVSSCIGFKVYSEGRSPEGIYLFISNHRSFMDAAISKDPFLKRFVALLF